MSFGLYTAVCGSRCQEKRLEILSNNLANVSTAGFKEDRPIFRVLDSGMNNPTLLTDADAQKNFMMCQKMNISYPALSGSKVDFSSGQTKYTGNPLDVAIDGPGFFVVNTPRGDLYTRAGNLSLNDKKELVTHAGYPLRGKGKHIKIEGTEVTIAKDGSITVDGERVDTLKAVDFKDYSSLKKVGDDLFKNMGGKQNEQKAEGVEIEQHYLELSNINIVKEMLKMIDVLRIYESYQKVIKSMDETDSRATRDVGQVA